ncbi:MAG: ACP S-malonyltransferase [Thermoleophilia bacterium]|nr:ACP S-malonyltransferase [Thermoleophilia bacterium]
MGRELAEAYPEVRAVLEEASEVTGLDLERLCFEGPLEELTETEIQQPALVATSLACLRAVETVGLEPAFVVGHSVGEYSALAACGALSARDAIRLVRERGLATADAARQHPGAMAAILGLDDAAVEELCDGIEGVWPANYNCPGQVVVSGAEEAIDRLLAAAAERGARRAVRLRISGAFHSPLVGAAGPRLRPALESADWAQPRVPFLSTVTADVEGVERFVDLLVDQLTAPVRFTEAVARLVAEGVDTFVEIGPGQVLAGLVRRCNRDVTALSVGDRASLAKLEEVIAA